MIMCLRLITVVSKTLSLKVYTAIFTNRTWNRTGNITCSKNKIPKSKSKSLRKLKNIVRILEIIFFH